MSIKAPPARGYEDWQRIQNYDSPQLYRSVGVAIPVQGEVAGPFDVSRYAYLGFEEGPISGVYLLQIQWTLDQAGTIRTGLRSIYIDTAITNTAQLRILNLGPWATVSWTQISGAATHTTTVFLTNRIGPLEALPVNPYLYLNSAASIPAGTQLNVWPTDYYAGPIEVWVNVSQAGNVDIQALQPSGTYASIQRVPITAGQNLLQQFIAPPGAWRLRVTNASGTTASTGTVAISYSNTGAA